jgi:alcohol dehydrogenase
VAVHGCGGVGLSAVMVAKALGARIVAVDLSTAALDALGSATVAAAAVAGLRPRGRHVQVGLLHGDDARAAVPMDLVVARELAVLGSHGMPAVDYPAMLDLVASGALDPERLVTRRIGLADAGAALAAMDGPTPPGITIVEP